MLEDESASVAGARSSYGAPSLEASRKDGSLLDLADTTRTPIIEEEGEPGADGLCKFLVTDRVCFFLFFSSYCNYVICNMIPACLSHYIFLRISV